MTGEDITIDSDSDDILTVDSDLDKVVAGSSEPSAAGGLSRQNIPRVAGLMLSQLQL